MKGRLPIKKVEAHNIGEELPDSLQHLRPRMEEIYLNLFNKEGAFDFNSLLKNRGDAISLGLFYGKDMELAGFAIAGIQTANIDRKSHAVFSAGIYSDLKYDIRKQLARFALNMSLKYKISHPTHHLGYLAVALTPAPYSLSARLLPECYPNPSVKTPEYVSSIMKVITSKRNFSRTDSEFVVGLLPRITIKNPENLLSSSKVASCKYYQYFLSLIPDFQSGNALLIYMPLTLKNILIGLKNHIKWYLKK